MCAGSFFVFSSSSSNKTMLFATWWRPSPLTPLWYIFCFLICHARFILTRAGMESKQHEFRDGSVPTAWFLTEAPAFLAFCATTLQLNGSVWLSCRPQPNFFFSYFAYYSRSLPINIESVAFPTQRTPSGHLARCSLKYCKSNSEKNTEIDLKEHTDKALTYN